MIQPAYIPRRESPISFSLNISGGRDFVCRVDRYYLGLHCSCRFKRLMYGGALFFRCSTGQAHLWLDHNVQPHEVIVRVVWYDPYFSVACRERNVVALQIAQISDFCTVNSLPDRHSLCLGKKASTCQVGPSLARPVNVSMSHDARQASSSNLQSTETTQLCPLPL